MWLEDWALQSTPLVHRGARTYTVATVRSRKILVRLCLALQPDARTIAIVSGGVAKRQTANLRLFYKPTFFFLLPPSLGSGPVPEFPPTLGSLRPPFVPLCCLRRILRHVRKYQLRLSTV